MTYYLFKFDEGEEGAKDFDDFLENCSKYFVEVRCKNCFIIAISEGKHRSDVFKFIKDNFKSSVEVELSWKEEKETKRQIVNFNPENGVFITQYLIFSLNLEYYFNNI